VSPVEVRVAVGARVTFVNDDTRPHSIFSDPATTHTDCPNVNLVGFLAQGESRETGSLTAARTCGFHDHMDEDNPTFQGRIVVE
jgi:plastocyanin